MRQLAAPLVVLMLVAAHCDTMNWALDVDGENGSMRILRGPEPDWYMEQALVDLPISMQGSTFGPSAEAFVLAAVPDCGFEFVQWSFADDKTTYLEPIIWARPESDWSTVTPRVLEAQFTPATAPRNDCFATPGTMPGEDVVTIGPARSYGWVEFDNDTAGVEEGEPAHGAPDGTAGASLWWVFEDASGGRLNVRVEYADFDPILAVYEGTTLADLTPIASCIAPACGEIEVQVTGGTPLRIVVDGVGWRVTADGVVAVGETGRGGLSWDFYPTPAAPDPLPTMERGD